ncbi:MAG: hypothetical protein NZ522_00575, partial [Chitinophagales bacterium]|nr:hypothetical protein [Chitinophagales bacterium]
MKVLPLSAAVFGLTFLNAQIYDVDALRFSRLHTSGTARNIGVAGAFGSVGADLSAVLHNPAGVAMYRSS